MSDELSHLDGVEDEVRRDVGERAFEAKAVAAIRQRLEAIVCQRWPEHVLTQSLDTFSV